MAAEPGAEDFVARLSETFARELFQPMVERATRQPADVRRLIGEFRSRLDALDLVIATCPEVASTVAGGAPAASGAVHWRHEGADMVGEALDVGAHDGLDEIGRNQRSRLREVVLLEALSRESRAFALNQLLVALEQKGFQDTSGAVVSQLHRLKRLGVIDQPANGMYEITHQGLGHLRKLKTSFGALLAEGR